ncbi:hypothetical protein J7L70_00255 [Candidatus Bathyarchaeota archaeon]|nr:hypothetical protein [Candidatus Bathyarchaeota archaeon]
MVDRFKTGVLLLDRLSMGGFPKPSNVLILGPPGVGKSILCRQILYEGLKMGGSGVYITLDEPENEIIRFMESLGFDVEAFLNDDRFKILESTPSNLADLNNLSIELANAIKKLKPGTDLRIMMDSLTSILSLNVSDIRSCIEFVRALNYRIKSLGASCFYSLNSYGFDQKIIALIEGIMDGVVEMRMEEDVFPKFYLRILKLKGVVHSRKWVRYRIDNQVGLIPYIPTVILTGPKGAGKKTLQNRFRSRRWRLGEVEVDVILCETFSSDVLKTIRYGEIDGFLLVLDSSDIESLTEFMNIYEKLQGSKIPKVILANKQDKPRALTPENLKEELSIPDEIPVIGVSALTGEGIEKALRTLTSKILGSPV